ncbi:hypothetical protein E2986_13641 [Frieseomelitta varia]|uniref:Uncharacterized protein n=1 Tax=Frieseomelitta varia TaxID=561572 RepID=A0A833VZ11_9HYME|nr:hypothetical protein E2986_13641 [Frieseomelitta varia]
MFMHLCNKIDNKTCQKWNFIVEFYSSIPLLILSSVIQQTTLVQPQILINSSSSNCIEDTKSASAATTTAIGNRKRKHIPDNKVCKKCHVVPDSNV